MANDAHTDSRRNKTSSEPVGEALLLSVSQFLQASHSERHTPLEIYVAYSGGLDSSVLLHAAAKHLRNNGIASAKLSAVHVNHHLSQHASQWALHCEQQAKALGIDFHCMDVHLPQRSRSSLEAQARDARYQAINDKVPKGSLVLLAQHQDDQAETFLLQLLRGSGPTASARCLPNLKKCHKKYHKKCHKKYRNRPHKNKRKAKRQAPSIYGPC